ncbi:MAG: phosphoesterase [Pedosphaera sp.]|nr:phosphoesterase [Pedosphaera sp.]
MSLLLKTSPYQSKPSLVLLSICALILSGCHSRTTPPASGYSRYENVGITSPQRSVTPANQVVTPEGIQVDLPGMRPQVIALSPDHRLLVTSGKTHELIVVAASDGTILQHVLLPSEESEKTSTSTSEAVSTHILKPDKDGQASFTGLTFSPDGRLIYLANVNGSVKVFGVQTNFHVAPLRSLRMPPSGVAQRTNDIPSGIAVSHDGQKLYVALNLSNRLLEMDATSGQTIRFFDVGVAPYGVVLNGGKAYVSNWGGRRPDAQSITGPAGRGTLVRVDPIRHIASEGSVSIIDLASGLVTEIQTGLHTSALALSPNRRFLTIANAGSDSVTVLDTRTDRIIETISLKWNPSDFFGASPNALTFDPAGKTLYVCNGTQNAVAVVAFRPGRSKLLGLIPTGWFPGDIAFDDHNKFLHVANIKGWGSGKRLKPGEPVKFGSHDYFGSLSLIPIPDAAQLKKHTTVVLRNYRRASLEASKLPPRPNVIPRPVPKRTGEPSVFKHVVYIIKENRTYDQVLGDIREGNGNADLCVFGEKFTPNQHKMVRDFVLLDNTYCSGILSADGHQWSTSSFATDYMEKSFAGFPRSYPDGMEDSDIDALAYSPAGFIWDNALTNGRPVRIHGEFAISEVHWKDSKRTKKPTFTEIYQDFIHKTGLINISSRPAVESIRAHMNTNTVGWQMSVPDIFRAAEFIKELNQFEQGGTMPALSIICLPNDHTSGTQAGMPTPAAHVADNDLAFGQIVEAISKSRFWKETCILAIEDDPQAGWDHVSGYRTTAYVVSPYTKRRAVIRDNYNQTSLIRTIELILGLPPMNIFDATATPMTACFTDQPDFTPFTAVPSNIPLDQLNPPAHAIADPIQRHYALESARLPLDEVDRCPETLLNHIIWTAQKGSHIPFPAWAITIGADDDDGR